MRLRDRLTWLFLSRFQTEEEQRMLKAQYHQWQVYGYSYIVEGKTLLISILLLITQLFTERHRVRANAIIHQVFGIPPFLYKTYLDRYMQFWNPDHIHTRLIIRLCPRLIPNSKRKYVLNQYRFWIKEVARSPVSALNEILDHIDS